MESKEKETKKKNLIYVSLTKAHTILEITGTIFKNIGSIVIALILIFLSNQIYDFIKVSELKEVNLFGLKYVPNKDILDKAEDSVSANINTKLNKTGSEDTVSVSEEGKQLLNQLEQAQQKAIETEVITNVAAPAEHWVYVGRYSKTTKKWLKTTFMINGFPRPNQQLKTLTDVYERDNKPIYINEWKMGNITGVIKGNSFIRIIDTVQIPGKGNTIVYWAKI